MRSLRDGEGDGSPVSWVAGSAPVGRHGLGNSLVQPAVVTYFCPAGEVQMMGPVAQLNVVPAPVRLEQVMTAA